ncbi:MAG: DUF4340 domain-containing protein [Planctomycetes bacterium]|nr:DUF4340 domain-containing protein [Planctomycetota bacterium]MBI3834178.1 DUF4340 domain-containing protein [Planctomycetota bacterium]
MNTKTTAFLALCLAGLVVALVFVRPQPQRSVGISNPVPTALTVHDLFEKKPGDITRTVVELKGKEPWVFEKKSSGEGAPATWRMTTPLDMPVASYEVERIGRDLSGLKYEIKYAKGEPGTPTDAQAGLTPPEAVVTLTDAANAASTVEIGKPFSENETYVRLKGSDAIVLAKSNLRKQFKTKPLEYRDTQVFNFAPENITKLEIIDRANPSTPVTYTFDKTGTQWMMQTPAIAKATGKIDEIVRLIGRLRLSQWYEDGKDRLAMFGLEPDPVTIRLTVDEPIPEKKEDDSADKKDQGEEKKDEKSAESPPEQKFKHSVHELHLSTRSPIGDELKVYARVDDESMVGTLVKTTAEKFMPHPSEWRDMRLITSNTDAATKIEINVGGTSTILALKNGLWSFESDASPADDAAVKELLRAIRDMNALAFVDAKPDEMTNFGFNAPQADVRLISPGEGGTDRITVGGYSDPATRRVVYLRHNESLSIAKVKVDDVANLVRSASAYRDRTIVQIKPDRLQRIIITRNDPAMAEGMTVTLEPRNGKWRMTAPIEADLREDRIKKIVDSFADLKGLSILAATDENASVGFDKPAVTVELTYGGSAAEGGGKDSAAQNADGTIAPEMPVTIKLDVVDHGGKFVMRRQDRKNSFEISMDLYDQLMAEYRTPELFTFDVAKVRQFSITNGAQRHGFTRTSSGWTYDPEPALPLDAKKVDNLLLQVKDLKTERYKGYSVTDLASVCLDKPQQEVKLQLDDTTSPTLLVAAAPCGNESAHFAKFGGNQGVFTLTDEMAKRIQPSISELEKK